MNLGLQIVYFLLSCVFLAKGGERTIKGLVKLVKFFRFTEFAYIFTHI